MTIDRTKYEGREPLCTCPEFDTCIGPMSNHEEDDPHCALNLLAELDKVTAQRDEAVRDKAKLLALVVHLTAQRDALAEALRRIAESEPRPRRDGHYDADVHQGMQRTARAALATLKETTP